MATKKATKKTATTKVATKRAPRKQTKKDNVYWVLMERSRMFLWTPKKLFATREAAQETARRLEVNSIYGGAGYKVERVELVD